MLPASWPSMSISELRLPTQKERGFPFLAHPNRTIVAAPEHCRVKTKQLKKKPYRTLDRSCAVLHNTQKTSEMSPLLAFEFSTQKQECAHGNAISPSRKAIAAPHYCHCSLRTRRKRSSKWKLLACTKAHEEPQCSYGQLERKGPQSSYVPTGEDALMLSKNYSLQVFLHSRSQEETSPVGRTRGRENANN